MFLGSAKNNTDGTYRLLNLRTNLIVLSRDVIWLNKTYGEYVSRKLNIKADTYILQDEDDSYNWDHVKIDSVKNEVKPEKSKNEEKFRTKQDSRWEEDVQKTIKSISFAKQ